jgi:hypothetical protein
MSGRYWLAGRPPSLASQLLQGIDVCLGDIGWLAGRYRWQASSNYKGSTYVWEILVGWQAAIASKPSNYKGSTYVWEILVGCQAAIAGKPAPTEKQRQKPRTPAALHHSSGRALARLQLLILIHPPPREASFRCSSGDWRAAPFDAVELIACRCQRSQPEGDAPG